MRFPCRRVATFLAAVALLLTGAGCSGGGGGGGGAPVGPFAVNNLAVAVVNQPDGPGCSGVNLEGSGTACVSFDLTGPANAMADLAFEYQLLDQNNLPISGWAAASPVPPAIRNQFTIPVSTATSPITVPASGNTGAVFFFWCIGCDLAAQANARFRILVDGMETAGSISNAFLGGGNLPALQSGGAGASAGNTPGNPSGGASNSGRGAHTAHNLGTTTPGGLTFKELLLTGGYNGSASPNAFSTADRFSIDAATYGIPNAPMPFQFQGSKARVLHASTFYLDPNDKSVKVFISGGVNDCTPKPVNPTGPQTLANRVGGATAEFDNADVYCFTPTELIRPPMGTMNPTMIGGARFAHTATWTANNEIVIIGGAQNTASPTAVGTILHWNVVTEEFEVAMDSMGMPITLSNPRAEHTATLLPNGHILIYGGHDPQNPGNPIPAEIYDPLNRTMSATVATGMDNRSCHCASRLANGWVLVTGGQSNAGTGAPTALNTARVYQPETGSFTAFLIMDRARYSHSHTLLGDGSVLIAGGVTGNAGNEDFTTNCQVFVPETFTFSGTASLAEARAEHSATAVDCGEVVVIGGRNASGAGMTVQWLDSIEVFPFSNTVPTLFTCNAAPGVNAGLLAISATVTDSNSDGGYVVIRYREAGTVDWRHANITQQTPTTATMATQANFPTMEVDVSLNNGQYVFIWDFAAQGLTTGQTVDIQIIPFGATLGSPKIISSVTLP